MIRRTLLIGAGECGALIGQEIQTQSQHKIIGYIDDDPQKQNTSLNNFPILGNTEELPSLIEQHKIDHIIFCMPSASSAHIQKIIARILPSPVVIQILPKYHNILEQDTKIDLPLTDIGLLEMLGYSQTLLTSQTSASYIHNKTVLITGAGGSIGGELSQLVASCKPSKLIILGRGENSIFHTHKMLERRYPELRVIPLITNITHKAFLEEAFRTHAPDILFHTAAHKHVYLMEENSKEAFLNNIMGSLYLLELAHEHNVEKSITISTDKAVLPTSVMGITKYITELITQHFNTISSKIFSAVRFGNVIGSRASVIPLFKKQIAQGGPITLTHPQATRYFMSISEAAQLVVESGHLAQGGEVFVLKMGDAIRIYDIAQLLLQIHRRHSHKEINIITTGLKHGEKLHELLSDPRYALRESQHKHILITDSIPTPSTLTEELHQVFKKIHQLSHHELREWMFSLYPK